MHSYKSLAVLALAVSTASTAYSAPLQEGQQQARSVIGGPLNVGRADPFNISAILDHLLKSFKPKAARDTVALDQRASVSAVGDIVGDILHSSTAKNVLSSLAGGAAGAVTGFLANKALNDTRRAFPFEPPPSCLGLGSVEAAVCAAKHPIERDDVSTRDVIDVLQFLKRQLIELD